MQVDQTLVDPHLEAIPGFGSLTTGGLSGGDAQSLRWIRGMLNNKSRNV